MKLFCAWAAALTCLSTAGNLQGAIIGPQPDLDRSDYRLYTSHNGRVRVIDLDGVVGARGIDPERQLIYSSGLRPSPSPLFAARTAGTSNPLLDDFVGIDEGSLAARLAEFRFYGGAVPAGIQGSQGGQIIFVDFFDIDMLHIGGFAADLGRYNDNLFAIEPLGRDRALLNNSGFIQMSGNDGSEPNFPGPVTTFQWWITSGAQIGQNQGGPSPDTRYDRTVFTFELTTVIPGPAGIALLGIGGVLASSHRRR